MGEKCIKHNGLFCYYTDTGVVIQQDFQIGTEDATEFPAYKVFDSYSDSLWSQWNNQLKNNKEEQYAKNIS